MKLDTERLKKVMNADPEFALASRMWDARLRYRLGDDAFLIVIRDGVVTEIVPAPGLFHEFTADISAPDEVWSQILAAVPPPLFQDLFPAQFHHGLRITGDLESFYCYYAAVRRTTDLMRQVNNEASRAA